MALMARVASCGSDEALPFSVEDIRIQVERILASAPFRSSRRCQALLRHIVERTLAGDTATLKERTLGIDVFGRPPDYDTNGDPVVRSTAGEIRKKLAQYYQDSQHSGGLRIELHPGSYIPEFHLAEAAPLPVAPQQPGRRLSRRAVWVLGAALAVLAAAAGALLPRWRSTDLDRFWGPMFEAQSGVLFCLGQPRVYNLRSDDRQNKLEAALPGLPGGSLESSQETIPLKQLVPMWDRYVALGDAACLLRLTSLFERRGRPYSIRGEASTSFEDLRERPAVLIGAFDNRWTLRTLGRLRYTFYKDFQGLEAIRDRDHPEASGWKLLNAWPEWNLTHDFAIVSRVRDPSTDRMVVISAGITQYGTAGAGEFLSNPEYFAEAVPRLPRDWPQRNLEIVLSVPVVHGASGHPRVLAAHTW
jgi:hypothetical protein